jgi:hypothetical protein
MYYCVFVVSRVCLALDVPRDGLCLAVTVSAVNSSIGLCLFAPLSLLAMPFSLSRDYPLFVVADMIGSSLRGRFQTRLEGGRDVERVNGGMVGYVGSVCFQPTVTFRYAHQSTFEIHLHHPLTTRNSIRTESPPENSFT